MGWDSAEGTLCLVIVRLELSGESRPPDKVPLSPNVVTSSGPWGAYSLGRNGYGSTGVTSSGLWGAFSLGRNGYGSLGAVRSQRKKEREKEKRKINKIQARLISMSKLKTELQ